MHMYMRINGRIRINPYRENKPPEVFYYSCPRCKRDAPIRNCPFTDGGLCDDCYNYNQYMKNMFLVKK